jgi:hypothetical protein
VVAEVLAWLAGLGAKDWRRLPADLRRALAQESRDKVAVPLAAKVASAAAGPWARVLGPSVKARSGADPKIVIGGKSPKLSGGGYPRAVVFGNEWGGGKRVRALAKTSRRRGHRRATTNQFRHPHPFIFRTVNREMDWVLDTFADITMTVLDKGVARNG